jgi:hypothetical protein
VRRPEALRRPPEPVSALFVGRRDKAREDPERCSRSGLFQSDRPGHDVAETKEFMNMLARVVVEVQSGAAGSLARHVE